MAAVDYFLKIEGIDGESGDSKHKGEIELESWSWGETQSGTSSASGGGGAGKVMMQDFHFVMKMNKASGPLFAACATGKHIKKALLTCRKAGGKQEEYFQITLQDLLVSSYQTGGSSGSDVVPIEQISINFAKITHHYKDQKADGTVSAGTPVTYDLKANTLS
jgi:type VI secretion system secreted protein Hcp